MSIDTDDYMYGLDGTHVLSKDILPDKYYDIQILYLQSIGEMMNFYVYLISFKDVKIRIVK